MCKEGSLIFRDYCERKVRQDDGEREQYFIPRHKCNNPRCGKVHRMLPDFMVPFKHYTEDVISDCVNHNSEESQICSGPSASTIDRWKRWMELNKPDIDGHLKSIGHRELGFSKKLMNTSVSLLEKLMFAIPHGWMRIILRMIYNSGAYLVPVYT